MNYFEDIGMFQAGSKLLGAYVAGFLASLALTFVPLTLILLHDRSHHAFFSHPWLIAAALACALLQLVVQLACFLHLSARKHARERLAAFGTALLVVFILMAGSVWIMFTLNDRMMPSQAQMMQYMNDEQGI